MTDPLHRMVGGADLFISGEVQFWRMDPASWNATLSTVKALGIDHVASYLSWRRHEPTPGTADLKGRHGAELDVHRFLDLCSKHELSVQLKPGPWICAEEPGGGLPDWVLADEESIALDHAGRMVSGYNPPFKHPMPSYASSSFRRSVAGWIDTVWSDLGEFIGEGGPLVATQLDNEPSLGFQDSMYGFDYHPESLDAFRNFVIDRHGSLATVAKAWGCSLMSVNAIVPPRPSEVRPSSVLLTVRERDWIDYQEHYIADYLNWLQQLNRGTRAESLVDFVNLNTHPVRGMPQSGGIIASVLTPPVVVGEDHYFEPPIAQSDIAGLALAAAQGIASGTSLVWAPEVQSGIWRSPNEVVGYPDPTDDELASWWGCTLAMGYQGFNLYMLVDRVNWEFAPVSPTGDRRPLAQALERMMRVIRAVPELAAYRPVPQFGLIWDSGIRAQSYRVAGTQSLTLTDWNDPEAHAGYEASVQAAAILTARGFHYSLVTPPERTSMPVVVTSAGIDSFGLQPLVNSSDPGIITRLHRNPQGNEVIYLVPWSRNVIQSSVQLRLADTSIRALREVTKGSEWGLEDGQVTINQVEAGLNLYRVLR